MEIPNITRQSFPNTNHVSGTAVGKRKGGETIDEKNRYICPKTYEYFQKENSTKPKTNYKTLESFTANLINKLNRLNTNSIKYEAKPGEKFMNIKC